MVRLNVSVITETEEERRLFIEAAVELVSLSLRDKGCIDYDLYQSKTNDDRLMIIETWESEEDLKNHSETEHFRCLVPVMRAHAKMITTKFEF